MNSFGKVYSLDPCIKTHLNMCGGLVLKPLTAKYQRLQWKLIHTFSYLPSNWKSGQRHLLMKYNKMNGFSLNRFSWLPCRLQGAGSRQHSGKSRRRGREHCHWLTLRKETDTSGFSTVPGLVLSEASTVCGHLGNGGVGRHLSSGNPLAPPWWVLPGQNFKAFAEISLPVFGVKW